MQQAGLIDKWHKKWWPKHATASKCANNDVISNATTVDFKSVSVILVILVVSVGASGTLLLLELCFHNLKAKAASERHCDIASANQPHQSENKVPDVASVDSRPLCRARNSVNIMKMKQRRFKKQYH